MVLFLRKSSMRWVVSFLILLVGVVHGQVHLQSAQDRALYERTDGHDFNTVMLSSVESKQRCVTYLGRVGLSQSVADRYCGLEVILFRNGAARVPVSAAVESMDIDFRNASVLWGKFLYGGNLGRDDWSTIDQFSSCVRRINQMGVVGFLAAYPCFSKTKAEIIESSSFFGCTAQAFEPLRAMQLEEGGPSYPPMLGVHRQTQSAWALAMGMCTSRIGSQGRLAVSQVNDANPLMALVPRASVFGRQNALLSNAALSPVSSCVNMFEQAYLTRLDHSAQFSQRERFYFAWYGCSRATVLSGFNSGQFNLPCMERTLKRFFFEHPNRHVPGSLLRAADWRAVREAATTVLEPIIARGACRPAVN